MRNWRKILRKSECGQATLEFLIVIPVFLGLIFLSLVVSTVWGGHHMSSAISLEGASREAAEEGSGGGFVINVGNKAINSTNFSVVIADYDWGIDEVPAKRFTVQGRVSVPWAPFGLEWSVPIQGTAYYPVWEFTGE